MQGTDCVPFLGMFGEIGLRRPGPVRPHRRQPGEIRRLPQGFAVGWLQPVEQGEEGHDPFVPAQSQENPVPLLAPLHQPGFGQDANMARHARLALPHNLGDFSHRKLHGAQQMHDPQPRRVAERPENVESGVHCTII